MRSGGRTEQPSMRDGRWCADADQRGFCRPRRCKGGSELWFGLLFGAVPAQRGAGHHLPPTAPQPSGPRRLSVVWGSMLCFVRSALHVYIGLYVCAFQRGTRFGMPGGLLDGDWHPAVVDGRLTVVGSQRMAVTGEQTDVCRAANRRNRLPPPPFFFQCHQRTC